MTQFRVPELLMHSQDQQIWQLVYKLSIWISLYPHPAPGCMASLRNTAHNYNSHVYIRIYKCSAQCKGYNTSVFASVDGCLFDLYLYRFRQVSLRSSSFVKIFIIIKRNDKLHGESAWRNYGESFRHFK